MRVIITDSKAIDSKIKSIAKRGASLDEDIQVAGMSVLAHIEKCGDVTLADKLMNAMPKSGRKLALAEWLLAYGKLETIKADSKDNKAAIAAGRVFKFAKDKATDISGADEKAWYEFRKEAKVSEAFDVQAQVKSLISRIQAATAAGKELKHKEEAIQEARALLAALGAAE